MQTGPRKMERGGWLALAAILSLYAALVWAYSPYQMFGRYHDDTLYASVARAIVDGQGQIQPNLPGSPPATKYPPGYAYSLAAVMAAFPAAYEDPALLWRFSAACGLLALTLAFVQLRGWKGVGWPWAAGAIAVCAAQPLFLLNSGAVLSDIPFMALALAAFLLADREPADAKWMLAAGALAGLATVTRTVGVAVLAGALASLALRRQFRPMAWVAAGAAPFALLSVASKLAPSAPPASATQGFVQTWLYYTDYSGFWRASVPSLDTFQAMLYSNLGMLAWAPAELCLGDVPDSKIAKVAWALASAAIVSGLLRQARADRWRAIHFGLLFTAPAVLLWNYEIGGRLLLCFAPLFAMGLLTELRAFAANVTSALKRSKPLSERAIAAVALGLLCYFVFFVADRTLASHRATIAAGPPASADDEYGPLYAWLRGHARPSDRFVAIDDGLFFLRTGLQGMWPLALTTEPRFNPDSARFDAQMDRLPEVAEQTGARFAIQTDHDYLFAPAMQQRWQKWTADLPVVAENPEGTARILDLSPKLGAFAPNP
ncbi:MAG: hypothetical protein H6509_05930 [Bryobacterales bacterium]|nr:hypothetical protein [Bryobacterales bacterium]